MKKDVKSVLSGATDAPVVEEPTVEDFGTLTSKPEVLPPAEKSKDTKDPQITIGVGELQKMFEGFANTIAQAMVEAKKPWIDPKAEQNNQTMRESMKELRKRMDDEIKAGQETCPHLQGSNPLSDFAGQLTSIVMHRTDTGLIVGICTNCQKKFYSDNPEDRKFFALKSGNRMSSAGQRFFLDPAKAQKAGR